MTQFYTLTELVAIYYDCNLALTRLIHYGLIAKSDAKTVQIKTNEIKAEIKAEIERRKKEGVK